MKWFDLRSKSFNNAVKPFVTITVTLKHSYAETPGIVQIFIVIVDEAPQNC